MGISACGTKAENTLPGNNWKVTRFANSTSDITAQFNGYEFFFKNNGQLLVKKGEVQIVGEWYDNDNNGERLTISVTGDSNVDDLSDDWYISNVSINEVKMHNTDTDAMNVTLTKL